MCIINIIVIIIILIAPKNLIRRRHLWNLQRNHKPRDNKTESTDRGESTSKQPDFIG